MHDDPTHSSREDTTSHRPRFAPFLTHLVVAATSLFAGVVLGGWIAFDTGHWEGFKAFIEGIAGGAPVVAFALVAVAVGVTLAASVRAAKA